MLHAPKLCLPPTKGNQMSSFQGGVVLKDKIKIGFRYCFTASKDSNKSHVFDVADQCIVLKAGESLYA